MTPAFPPTSFRRYRVEHETRYAYSSAVTESWQLARLTPRELPWQRVLATSLEVDPHPGERRDASDSFGNTVTHFGLRTPHDELAVRMRCEVEVAARPEVDESADSAWEAVRDAIRGKGGEPLSQAWLTASAMSEPTQVLPSSESARAYAATSLVSGRSWLQALDELMHRIHAEFEFDPHATHVSTSVEEVLQQRRGVCQDFAHLMLAGLRAHGLPARYMSGYLLTDPPPGKPRLMGVDASHAWVAAYAPAHGWVEFDPTNDQRADSRYITLGWGADFGDVAPLRGVIIGGGEQRLEVAVSVTPL